ncbi:juvenile hormone esterase-like [Microplitis mediator]|uniref:juvenile hormone esterase-like n=1 Tax=Microplitis mediator TaxID=375433 RepID=UPI00255382D0|nr:juvenile hormone esterase-like [Microplitis mediator]
MEPKFGTVIYAILLNFVVEIVVSSDGSLANYLKINRPIVEVEHGQVKGIRDKNVDGIHYFYAFRGIPYAKPPIGELRFQDPEPLEAWVGIRDAKEFGDKCVQVEKASTKRIGNEDCLYLNVYTTDLKPDAPKAVMVWIHGGAFVSGSGDDDKCGPDYFVEKNVLLVTINYRLNILGFLNLDDEAAPGNQGLKDQVMALKWVQKNINKFGGDPNNVTIFGQSTGSSSVHSLTLSPLAQGLFHRAILQSSVANNPRSYVSYPIKDAAQKVAEKLGKNVTDQKELLKFLKGVNASSLIGTVQSLEFRMDNYAVKNPFVPSVDSKSKSPFLEIPINEAVKSGIKVPHILGHNSQESIFFLADLLRSTSYAEREANQEKLLLHPNGKKFLNHRNVTVGDVKKFFMGSREIKPKNVYEFLNLVSADFFIFNIHDTLEIQSSVPGVPTYFYKFDHYSKETSVEQKLIGTDLEGTSHSEDLFYLFNAKILKDLGIEAPASYPTERIIQQRFLELWTNFAKTGNPNLGSSDLISIEWKPIDDSTDYNCLKISKDLSLIKEPNILHRIKKNNLEL